MAPTFTDGSYAACLADGHGGSVPPCFAAFLRYKAARQATMTSDSQQSKNDMRQRSLARRSALTPELARRAAQDATNHLLDFITATDAAPSVVIACYLPVRGEIDMREAFAALEGRGYALCLPVVAGNDEPLLFRRWHIDDALEQGKFGIAVPAASSDALIPDVVIVPLVAFDAKGHRLGYGAGYYDRTLHQLRKFGNVQAIGVAYASQQVENIVAEAHDALLYAVVTEKGVVRFR
jgi:5-formyltetrahydrofolate cyclo-ligase